MDGRRHESSKSDKSFVPNIPPGSTLVLLSELPRIALGVKVRFLGCVDSYDASSATITCIDKYPSGPSGVTGTTDEAVRARLDVSLVLPPVTPKQLFEVGSWLMIIGYIPYNQPAPGSSRREQSSNTAHVQVLMILSSGRGSESGGMQDERYLRAVEARRKGMRALQKASEGQAKGQASS